jgi:hypothetical protein
MKLRKIVCSKKFARTEEVNTAYTILKLKTEGFLEGMRIIKWVFWTQIFKRREMELILTSINAKYCVIIRCCVGSVELVF